MSHTSEESTQNSISLDEQLPPPKVSNKRSVWLVSITLIVSTLVLGFGCARQFGLISYVIKLSAESDGISIISFGNIASKNAFFLERRKNGQSETFALDAGSGAPYFFARPDENSFGPAPSPNGVWVAYFIKDENDKLAISVSKFNQNPKVLISQQSLSQVDNKWAEYEICSYGQILWSTDDGRVATFICAPREKKSYLVTAEIGQVNIVVLEKTEDNTGKNRSAVWTSQHNIVLSKTEDDVDLIFTIDISEPNKLRQLSY